MSIPNPRVVRIVTLLAAMLVAGDGSVLANGEAMATTAPASRTATTAATAPTTQPTDATNDWPQWRGPNRDGIVVNSPRLLDSWPKEGPPLLWKSGFIPAWRDGGCSAPVVADGKVFVYANRHPRDGGETLKFITDATLEYMKTKGVPAADIERLGKLKDVGRTSSMDWSYELRGVKDTGLSHHMSYGPLLRYLQEQALEWADTLYCLDAATGKTLWKKVFPVNKATLKDPGAGWWCFDNLGVCATPAVGNGKAYMVGSAGLYCLSVKDGALLWQVKSGPEHASPLVEDGILYHCGVAYDAETGAVKWKNPLWTLDAGKHVRTEDQWRFCGPVLWKSGGTKYILAANAKDKAVVVACLELQTGKLRWTAQCTPQFFTAGMTLDALLVEGMAGNTPISHAFRMTPAGTELLWKGQFEVNGAMSGGVMYQGNIYGWHSELTCASLKTGNVLWKVADGVCCPQVVADGKIFGSKDSFGYSDTVPVGMVRPNADKYEPLGSFNAGSITMCPVIIVDGKMLVRQKDGIACYDIQDHGAYLDTVAVTKDTLTFRFKQTGGGITGDLGKLALVAFCGSPLPGNQAAIKGDSIVVDLKGVDGPFSIVCPANALKGMNGLPLPAFSWNESRQLEFKKAYDNLVILKTTDLPLKKNGAWDQPSTYAIAGAKVTAVEVNPLGDAVLLTTDKSWKTGDALKVTYAPFPVDQGEPRRETVAASVTDVVRPSAKFLKADTTTIGDWKGVYGSEGAVIAGDGSTPELSKAVKINVRNANLFVPWAASNKDPNRPLLIGSQTVRSVKEWGSYGEYFVDLEFADAKEHQVAVYCGGQRACSVEALDAETRAVLDKQPMPDNKTQYQVWNLKGNVTLHYISVGGTEASSLNLRGVFFDPVGATSK